MQTQNNNETNAEFFARMTAEDKARDSYLLLIRDLKAIEVATGFYLSDENVDLENVDKSLTVGSVAYWNSLYSCAANSAGFRCEGYNQDVNKLLGRSVY